MMLLLPKARKCLIVKHWVNWFSWASYCQELSTITSLNDFSAKLSRHSLTCKNLMWFKQSARPRWKPCCQWVIFMLPNYNCKAIKILLNRMFGIIARAPELIPSPSRVPCLLLWKTNSAVFWTITVLWVPRSRLYLAILNGLVIQTSS